MNRSQPIPPSPEGGRAFRQQVIEAGRSKLFDKDIDGVPLEHAFLAPARFALQQAREQIKEADFGDEGAVIQRLLAQLDPSPAVPVREQQEQIENDQGAGLIHQAIPDVAETEPRPRREMNAWVCDCGCWNPLDRPLMECTHCKTPRADRHHLIEFVRVYPTEIAGTEPRLNRNASGMTWTQAALIFGETLSRVGPIGYYDYTPEQWLSWARSQVVCAQMPSTEHSAEQVSAAQKENSQSDTESSL